MAKTKTTKTTKTSKSTKKPATVQEVPVDRRAKDRRAPVDRRKQEIAVKDERRQGPRRKVARRRQIDPTTCERDYNLDEIEFMQALDEYKRTAGRMFPTCSEILEVLRAIGYRKLSPAELEQLRAVTPAEAVSEPANPLADEAMSDDDLE